MTKRKRKGYPDTTYEGKRIYVSLAHKDRRERKGKARAALLKNRLKVGL